jgi:hypothetical protein
MKGIGLLGPFETVSSKGLGNCDTHVVSLFTERVLFSSCDRSSVCEHTPREWKGAQVQFPVAQFGGIACIEFGVEANRPVLSAPFMSKVGKARI